MLGGAIAAILPRETRPRGTTAALVLGSLFPDADIVLAPPWFDVYFLHVHPAVSHALIWSPVEAIVFAGLLKVAMRGARFGVLALAGWIGVLGHVFSDFADGSDIALFSPFSQVRYGWHLFGMAEPFVLALLAAACVLAWRWPARARGAALSAFAAIACILAGKAVTQRWAGAQYVLSVPEPQNRVEIMPVRADLFAWDVYDQVDDRVRAWRIDGRTGRYGMLFERRNAGGAIVEASRRLPVVSSLIRRTTIQVIRVEHEGEDPVVMWSDARMCGAQRCDVSFGGVFTPDGVPLSQLITVGEFRQHRPLPRE